MIFNVTKVWENVSQINMTISEIFLKSLMTSSKAYTVYPLYDGLYYLLKQCYDLQSMFKLFLFLIL